MERLHILDGYGYIFRAYYGLAGERGIRLTNSAGQPTGALYVYARMLIRMHLDLHPERIVVVFDAPGPTFRNQLDDQYKANRRETPEDLVKQMPYFRPLTEAFSWPVIAVPGVEADDVIATLVNKANAKGWKATVFTGDKDLMQLVDDSTTVIDAMRQIHYDEDRVVEKFGVKPNQLRDWLALVGDASDNVPGMTGVGKKTATKLLTEHGTIDEILAHVSDMRGKQKERFSDQKELDKLALSRQLVTLKQDVSLDMDLEALVPGPWQGTVLRDLLQELEFEQLLAALDIEPNTADTEAPAAHDPIVVNSTKTLAEQVRACLEAGEFAIRVDTDGDRADRTHVVGLALAVEGHAPAYIPIAHRYLSAPAQLSVDLIVDGLQAVLADPAIKVVCHDAKTLHRSLQLLGLEVDGIVCDTMLAAYLLDPSRAANTVEQLVQHYLGKKIMTRKELLGTGKSAKPMESIVIEQAAEYSGKRAESLLALRDRVSSDLTRFGLSGLLHELELPISRLLAQIEGIGVLIDVSFLRKLSERVSGQLAEIERSVHEIAGEQLNVGSPKQLSAFLFDTLGLHSTKMKKTKTGYSTDHEVLESLIDDHPIIAPILEYRELTKLKSTYIDALPPLVNPNTGRLHTSFNQAVAATGRLSSQDPNLQNIPIRSALGKEIRRAFIASPGKTLISADYSQIELRILAHLSGDPVLLRAFCEGDDVHTQTAAEVFGIPASQVGAHERRVAKAVNYGLAYGQSDFGLSRALGIPRKEAKGYIESYFARFATIRDFMDQIVESALESGYVTTILGRRRPVPDLASKNYQRRQAAKRIAQNTPMQGSGADIIKLAMLAVDKELVASGTDAQILLTVHDELLIEVSENQAEQVAQRVKEKMEGAYSLKVPLKVDTGIATNWADAH